MNIKGKIVNDPVYGFIRFPEPEVLQIIDHPRFQRLRYIKQMGTAHLVYPGAVHTRFQHSMGACHLMGKALDELIGKGVDITPEDYLAARIAVLLHDVGHGPFSHALEHTLVSDISHEYISQLIMRDFNKDFSGKLEEAINVFNQTHCKEFLHQLVSSQLDVDRMDYLNRDSFYTGVSEGVIGYDRILQMLTVQDNQLMVESKGVHSVEKFIIARRLMYWQVYLHKTVLGSEILLINILNRAKELAQQGVELEASNALKHFLYNDITKEHFDNEHIHLEEYCKLDDNDIVSAMKSWCSHNDNILSHLCRMMMFRKLYKVQLTTQPIDKLYEEKREVLAKKLNLSEEELNYFVCKGKTSEDTYNIKDEGIYIAMKDGSVKDLSGIDNPVINQALAMPVHKNYICYIQP